MDLGYDATLRRPAFDLPSNSTSVLKALYEAFHPRFPFNTRDMNVTGGNFLSDVHVGVTLFNGNVVIDISADRLSLFFNQLRSEEDLKSCQECIALTEHALKKSLPDVQFATVAIKPTLHLEMEGDQDFAAHMSRRPALSLNLDLSAFAGAVQLPGVNVGVSNTVERWDALFHAFGDQSRVSSWTLIFQAIYHEDGAVRGLEHRVTHSKQLLRSFFDAVDLKLEGLDE